MDVQKMVKASSIKKDPKLDYLKQIAKALERIAEELAVINERSRDE